MREIRYAGDCKKIEEERMSRMHDHGRLRRYGGFLMASGMLGVIAASAQEFSDTASGNL
jgi:hypothetical protein